MRGIGPFGEKSVVYRERLVNRLLFEKSARLTDQRQQQKQNHEGCLCRWHSRSRTLGCVWVLENETPRRRVSKLVLVTKFTTEIYYTS
jgi:hypothetical protein